MLGIRWQTAMKSFKFAELPEINTVATFLFGEQSLQFVLQIDIWKTIVSICNWKILGWTATKKYKFLINVNKNLAHENVQTTISTIAIYEIYSYAFCKYFNGYRETQKHVFKWQF